jgi:hypothetical protein
MDSRDSASFHVETHLANEEKRQELNQLCNSAATAGMIFSMRRQKSSIKKQQNWLYQAQQGNPQRFISKAQRWLRWVMPLAVRLDRQVNSSDCQTKIRELQAECKAVLLGVENTIS